VRGRAVLPEEQGVQPMLGAASHVRHGDAKPPQPRRPDGDEHRRNRLDAGRQIAQAFPDQVRARQPFDASHNAIIRSGLNERRTVADIIIGDVAAGIRAALRTTRPAKQPAPFLTSGFSLRTCRAAELDSAA
jgi:hypothetical protein